MKVAIVRNSWRHHEYGGAEDLMATLVKSLSKSGVEMIGVSGSKESLKRNPSYVKGPRPFTQNYLHKIWLLAPVYWLFDLIYTQKYLRLFKQLQPDLVHLCTRDDWVSASKAAAGLNIPVIWTDPGDLKTILSQDGNWLKQRIIRRVKASMELAQKIYHVSQDDQRAVAKLAGNPNNAEIIYLGVAPLTETTSPKYDLGFAGRAVVRKGIYELLEAHQRVNQDRSKKLKLLINSDMAEDDEVSAYIASQQLKDITIAPYSDQAISQAKLFVLPTYSEGLSLALLRAASAAQPIITTNLASNIEALGSDGAIYVEPRSIDQLEQAIAELVDQPKQQKDIAKKAHQRYTANFTEVKMVENYLAAYNSLLGDKKAKS